MLNSKTPILNQDGEKFRSAQYRAMESVVVEGINEGVKCENVKSETREFVHKWMDDFSYLV